MRNASRKPLPKPAAAADTAAILAKAVLRASDRLGVNARTLARIVGLSEASVSRMKHGGRILEPGSKAFELCVLFVRLFRSIDAIAGGDEATARNWLRNPNTAIGDIPLERIQTIAGFLDVIAYLDARRAPV